MSRAIDAEQLVQRVLNKNFFRLSDKLDILNFISEAPEVISDSAIAIADCSEPSCEAASIIFRPICSRCGRRIVDTEIDFVRDVPIGDNDRTYFRLANVGHVEPITCPHCNTLFETIEIPTKLPYIDRVHKTIKLEINA